MEQEDEKVHVQKDGRLVLPRRKVEAAGLSPQDEVNLKDIELTKKGRQRRAVLRWIVGIGGVGWVAAKKIAVVEELLQFGQRTGIYDPDADQARLERLFGVGSAESGALLPAANHPFKKPPAGSDFYPTESDNCAAYRKRFLQNIGLRTVAGFPNVKPDDSIVLFGSQVSNLNTRLLLGNPFGLEKPMLELVHNNFGWRAQLHWNLFTPSDAAFIERQQYGAPWVTRNHVIGNAKGQRYTSRVPGEGLDDDYLLITTLPRFAIGKQKVVIFAGCHGPGQMATTLLLGGSQTKPLADMDKVLFGEPFYQALFHVEVTRDAEGEFSPKTLSLIEAAPVKPIFKRS